ncbi:reverse transcriptase [Trichonephila clavipes]|uniref:Reverse transcriptase n=1 Tax=Trichonephila clavipes TaxID=2585209 RepID=A0A8X7BEN3_TRICX|nr:reverse transcriptase [Trichonephila clavipes]
MATGSFVTQNYSRSQKEQRACTATGQEPKTLGKSKETLDTVGPIPRHLERAEAVAHFSLTSGRDFLGVYLHWPGLADDEACSFSGHARMDGDHLLQCTRLDKRVTENLSVGPSSTDWR